MSKSTASGHARRELPTKTKLVTALFAVGGVLSFPVGFLLLSASSAPAVAGASSWAGLLRILASGTFVLGGTSLTLAYGLWNVRPWSWYGTELLTALGISFSVWIFVQGVGLLWYNVVVGLAVIWALWDDQSAFGLDHELPV